MWFFTADEHYSHKNIIKYCNRPFESIEEMNETLIKNHNEKVGKKDVVVHVGDFTLITNKERVAKIIKRLKGNHIFIKGSHDCWLPKTSPQIWERKINGHYIVACHYAMRVWPRSHFNSFLLYGHSHGKLPPIGKSWDVGVDNNNFYPLSLEEIIEIMKERPDNPNLIERRY